MFLFQGHAPDRSPEQAPGPRKKAKSRERASFFYLRHSWHQRNVFFYILLQDILFTYYIYCLSCNVTFHVFITFFLYRSISPLISLTPSLFFSHLLLLFFPSPKICCFYLFQFLLFPLNKNTCWLNDVFRVFIFGLVNLAVTTHATAHFQSVFTQPLRHKQDVTQRSIFKHSTGGFNPDFSFSYTGCLNKAK